jgi:hypothetical protein
MPTDFFLINPVARSFHLNDTFNAPRNYTFAPTKLQLHEGVDIAAVDAQGRSVAVFAAQRGVVDTVGFSASGYGNYVRIVHDWHDGKWVTWYGHLSETSVRAGQFVMAGDKIGIAGTTGFSSGIHLHLTLQHIGHGLKNYTVDDVVDPEPFFRLGVQPTTFTEMTLVSDVTFRDGTETRPGQSFEKVWRVRNTGTTTWDAGYKLVPAGGETMGGPESVALLSIPVQPGQLVDWRVSLIAPATAGQYRGAWRLRAPDGTLCDQELHTQIRVKEQKPLDEVSYLADVTIEDGTVVQPGEMFVKTWRVRNSGTTTWNENYSKRWTGNQQMDGPQSVPLGRKVAPGEVIELSVTLKAPTTPGRQRSTWKLHNAQGQPFDYDQYAEIQVPKKLTKQLSEMRWVADVTIPDETVIQPGESFVKTWRVRNSGTTTWGAGYTLAFFADEQMGGPQSVPLPPARPGETVDVSVRLVAPTDAGMHKSTWKGRDPQGGFFEFDMFVLIEVAAEHQTRHVFDEMRWMADVTIPDGTRMKPGETFLKTWRVSNSGTSTWVPGYTLAFVDGEPMGGPASINLPFAEPGTTFDISLRLTAPLTPGLRKSVWKARDSMGQEFDEILFALIDVVDPSRTYDLLPYLQGDGRQYDLQFNWDGGGRQRIQTQIEDNKFYHVKDSEWEELWCDENYIYRGTDTSCGDCEAYTLTENGHYGSAWIPRKMAMGAPFRRSPQVVFRRKDDGTETHRFNHVTWIVLDAVYPIYKLPSGIELRDVAQLTAYEDDNGKPKLEAFEHYYYAKGYGLVAWDGSVGQSFLVQEFTAQPNNQREVFSWLIS